MTPIGWVALAVSVLGCLWGWRFMFRIMAADGMIDDWFELLFCVAMSAIFSAGWPLFMVYIAFNRITRGIDPKAVAEALAGADRATRQERRALRLREREIEVRRQEIELGIGVGE